ncbi:Tox-REase-5 domain-containing protein [Streptomyces sp.]|uniref:Tox-REase-5 domain-containing protein n=1 Tax=Streptomyces sp. TaxID=1931 RepID=UPI002F923CE1
MPRALRATVVLLYALFGFTVLGATGALVVAGSGDGVDAELLGLLTYGALPGVAGFALARRARTGGVGVWRGLLAVQAWLIVGALGTGVTQLALPVAVTVLLCRPASRAWFRLAAGNRSGGGSDRGQGALEYVGLVALVAAIILGLVATGVGPELTRTLSTQVCRITGGGDCGAGGGAGAGTGVVAGGRSVAPVAWIAAKCGTADPEKAARAAKRKAGLEKAQKQPKPAWYPNLRNPRAGTVDLGGGRWTSVKPALFSWPSEMGVRYQEQISGVKRGKEYRVPLDKLTGKPVDFDGWDAKTGTYLEAKLGYRSFYDEVTGELDKSIQKRWTKQAARQLDAARGKPVVWHLSDPDVAEAARKLFKQPGFEKVRVVHTPADLVG